VALTIRGHLSLHSLDFYRMLFRSKDAAVSVRVNLGELRAKEKDLRGIVDPQQESNQRTAAPYAEPAAPLPK